MGVLIFQHSHFLKKGGGGKSRHRLNYFTLVMRVSAWFLFLHLSVYYCTGHADQSNAHKCDPQEEHSVVAGLR